MVGLVCRSIENSFDAVWRLMLIDKLSKNQKKQKKIIRWANLFLSQGNVYVIIKKTRSEKISPTAGVPQGIVVTPALFLICFSNIPRTLAEISQFADYFALFYNSKSGQVTQSKLQASLNIFIKWCDMLKIIMNPAKTKYMLFKNHLKDKQVSAYSSTENKLKKRKLSTA